ncbi:hypothetical protein [Mycoplasmopsis bovigenitalium]|uniref:hypothetical protein n=1 Tax=Mycoplasmopsis bovigenitalium TaxID=2112 RepID=UPI00058D5E9C|nr:hypothetical protein [Mycoplasmopsis bovigenitalium]
MIFNKDIFNKKYNNSWINTQKSKVNKAEWEVIKDSKVVKNFRIRDINQKYESNIFDFMTGCSYIHDKDLDLFIYWRSCKVYY